MVVNPEQGTILLQRKVKKYYDFERPDYVDFTVGGHYLAGESVENGVRELQEEIGITASFDNLIPLGIRQTAHTITDTFKEYEFQHLFLYPTNRKIEEFTLQESEVKGLVEITIQQGIDLLLEKVDEISAKSITMTDGVLKKEEITLTRKEFVPSYITKDKIFVRLFIAAKRYARGESVDEILA